jgi:peptidoglycan/LPS O-acetylase OafA/YrhL
VSFSLYSVGLAMVIGGLSYAGYLLHIPAQWIVAGAVVLLGMGILSAVKATRQKDPVG